MQVDFYHLTATPLERALPRIAERVLESGARLLIVSASDTQRTAIDKALWTTTSDSFLPHAQAGGEGDEAQPILIAADCSAPNAARHIALIDGTWRDEALTFDRAFHFFDETAIEAARAAWRALAEREGVERRYWKQSDAGRWEQVA